MSCIFCSLDCAVYIAENSHFMAIWDKHPVSRGHALIISKRHFADYFDMKDNEAIALQELCSEVKQIIAAKFKPDAYNLAMNCGAAAGQSVFHFHLHIIPRYGKPKSGIFGRGRESLF